MERVRIPAVLNPGDYISKSRRVPMQVVQVYRAEDFGPRPGGRAARFQIMVKDAAAKEGKVYELDRRMIAHASCPWSASIAARASAVADMAAA